MIGYVVDADTINRTLGEVCKQLQDAFVEIETLKAWSAVTTQEAIEALGFATDDAYLVKLLIDDLDQLRALYEGADTLAAAKDFREQMRKAWGL